MSAPAPTDRGRQPERTRLAWRRTLLALTVIALVALRVLPPVLGPWSVGLALAILLLTGWLWALSVRRASAVRTALVQGTALPDGAVLAGLAGLVAGGSVVGLVIVLLLAVARA